MNKLEDIKKRYLRLFNYDASSNQISIIEKVLELELPYDFKEISNFYAGGQIGNQEILTISGDMDDEYSITNRTLELRKAIRLPKKYLVLYQEYGAIYLDTKANDNRVVFYCSNEDSINLNDNYKIVKPYYIFSSFADFFNYLLDEEEELRKQKF